MTTESKKLQTGTCYGFDGRPKGKRPESFRVFTTTETCVIPRVVMVKVGDRSNLQEMRQSGDYFEVYGPLSTRGIIRAAKQDLADYAAASPSHARLMRYRAQCARRVLRHIGLED